MCAIRVVIFVGIAFTESMENRLSVNIMKMILMTVAVIAIDLSAVCMNLNRMMLYEYCITDKSLFVCVPTARAHAFFLSGKIALEKILHLWYNKASFKRRCNHGYTGIGRNVSRNHTCSF